MRLPTFLKPLFWDLEFDRLDPVEHRESIVVRIVEYGTDDAVRWMRSAYTDAEIAAAIEAGRHRLSEPAVNLWRLWLEKPEDWCETIPSRPLRGTFWPN